MNPYKQLDDYHFWRRSISRTAKHLVDPVLKTKFTISQDTKVATAGSCFAQHISRRLTQNGFNYFVTENGDQLQNEEKKRRNYGVFSARYGNLYTVTQLLQLAEEATGISKQKKLIWERNGNFVDGLRPLIESEGFKTAQEVIDNRTFHLKCTNRLLHECDVFVFTLGLTEAWRQKSSGTVVPLAPGISGGVFNDSEYEFVNFGVIEVIEDLSKFLDLLKSINPTVKVILTVSPVPLIATYEKKHVLVSTTYSKSVLRVAAEEVYKNYEWVDYFPSFEIITGNHTKGSYFEDDLREVNEFGVNHVMRLFMHHYANQNILPQTNYSKAKSFQKNSNKALSDVVCDEEEIERNS